MLTARGQREGPRPRAQGGSRPSAFFMSGGHSQQRDLGRRCSARGRGKVGGRGSGFINVLRAGALSAISGEKESHRPWETEKGGGYPQSSQLRSAPNDSKPHNRVQVTSHICGGGAPGEKGKYEINLFAAVAFYFSCFRSISHINISAAEVNGKAASHPRAEPHHTHPSDNSGEPPPSEAPLDSKKSSAQKKSISTSYIPLATGKVYG